MNERLVIGGYLGAAVAANITVQYFGPTAMPIIAFVMIGLDLTSRDYLHEAWQGKRLGWKMLTLIGGGSVLTYLVNHEAKRIAWASFLAFASAGATDAVTYALLKGRARRLKVNGSNMVSGLVDSVVFPAAAFGLFNFKTVGLQYAAKVAGGWVWSMNLEKTVWEKKN
jgi:hypothetical protein